MTRPQFPRRAHQVAAEITPAQHHTLARLMRLPERSATAARMVLVDGERVADAAQASGVSERSLYRTLGRMRAAHEMVRGAYNPRRSQEIPMDESRFASLMRRARSLPGDYGSGYQRGLRRCYHGEQFGTDQEHATWSRLGLNGDPRVDLGRGYRDGLAGRPPLPE